MRGFRILEMLDEAAVPTDVRDAIYAAASEPTGVASGVAFFARVERLEPTEESPVDAWWLHARSRAPVRAGDIVESGGETSTTGEIVTVHGGELVRAHGFHVMDHVRVLSSTIENR